MQLPKAPNDSALLGRYANGDRDAAASLFERFDRPLREYLRRRLRDGDRVDEAAQETFCRMLQRAGELAEHPRPAAWLFAVARNVSADMIRDRRARGRSVDGDAHAADSDSACPFRRTTDRELNRLVVRAMEELSDAERRVFLMRTQACLTFREISVRVGAPLNTVLSRMHRALRRIRRSLLEGGWRFSPGGGEGGTLREEAMRKQP